MLNSIRLINFGVHTDRIFNFTPGINGIRGANEKGKSTLLLAILYAIQGARALPESLEEYVTWGCPANSLRVEFSVTINGQEYTGYRAKSGAELTGNGITVSGASEVSNFFVRSFGADMQTLMKVAISDQDGLRSALADGSGSLIERLGKVGLIEHLINGMQTGFSCGNTKALELQIAESEQNLAEKPTLDLSSQQEALQAAEGLQATLTIAAQELGPSVANLKVVSEAATAKLNACTAELARQERLQAELEQLQKQIAEFVDGELHDVSALEAVQARQAGINETNLALAKFDKLVKHPRVGSVEQYSRILAESTAAVGALNAQITTAAADIKSLQRERMSSGVCPTCKTVLTDPEIIKQHNAGIDVKIEALKALELKATGALPEAKAVVAELAALNAKSEQLLREALAIRSHYVQIDTQSWPVQVAWTGPGVQEVEDVESAMAQRRAENRALLQRRAAQEARIARQGAVQQELASSTLTHVDADEVAAAQEAYKEASRTYGNLQQELRAAAQEVTSIKAAIDTAEKVHAVELSLWEERKARIGELRTMLDEILDNNDIIKRLRSARPVVVNKLWNIVLHLVSESFSDIRGSVSRVTRENDTFMIDGKPLGVYSGSTKDSLALAIRGTLQRVFLPNVSFMIVDEPGRGMDDDREANMLAQLSRVNIPQIIVVTHSPLVDTYATNLVEI